MRRQREPGRPHIPSGNLSRMRSRTLIHAAAFTGTADGCLQTGEGEASGMEGGVKGSGEEERKEEAEAQMEEEASHLRNAQINADVFHGFEI